MSLNDKSEMGKSELDPNQLQKVIKKNPPSFYTGGISSGVLGE